MFTLSTTITSKSYAYDTFNDHVLTGGVGNYGANKRYYWLDGSTFSEGNLINTAMDEWIYSTGRTGVTTPISFRSTTTKSSSVIDFYKGSYYDEVFGILAVTWHYRYDRSVDEYYENWGWTEIWINSPSYDREYAEGRKATIAHEIGHALGLAHVSSVYSLMYSTLKGAQANTATADEMHGINYLY